MKKLSKLLLCLIVSAPLFFANAANDTYFIPDTAFRTALQAAYPSCFTSSDSLIKSCANEATLSSLNVVNKGISSIEGIQHFTNLKSLYCNLNNLTNLPTLPAGLTFIDASENCFCSTPLVKPNGITQENWNVEPNKSSCIVHFSLQEAEYKTEMNIPITIKLGKSLFFDGIDDYFEVESPFPITSTFTIECWAKPTKLPSQFNYVELKEIVNHWNHLAITKIGDSIKVYQNGILKVSKLVATSITIDSLVIGLGNNKYNGQMNDLKIWKTVRTVSDLKASMVNFNAYTDPDLIGAWNMTAHSGTELKDYSKNADDGTVYGCAWLNEDNSLSFSWSPSTNLSTNKGTSVEFNGSTPGNFDYTITATKKNGCKAAKEMKVTIKSLSAYDSLFLNPKMIGTSFQNPIEMGELNKNRTEYSVTNYIKTEKSNKYVYFSFIITDSSRIDYYPYFYLKGSDFDSRWQLYTDRVSLYNSEFKEIDPRHENSDDAIWDNMIVPGKYYLVINIGPGYFHLNPNLFIDVCLKKTPRDTTIISESSGACFQYTDTREVKERFYCQNRLVLDKFYYKITLDSARILEVTTCGSGSEWGKLEIYDHLGNKINFDYEVNQDFYGGYCNTYDPPYFIRYLKAGTYFIVNSFWGPGGSSTLNVSTNGASCPIKQKATYTKSISAGILDANRTYFSDTKNNDPINGYSTVDSDRKDKIIYSFQLLQPGMATISVCNSELSNPSVSLKTSSYYSNKSKSWYNGKVDNSIYDDTLCTTYGTINQYLTAGTYYVLSGGHDNSYGNITTEISVDFNCPTCEKEEPVILGMEDIEISDNISLSPNPSSGKTNLSLPALTENVSVTISDLSGKIVQRLVASNSVTEINTEELSEGLYYVSFLYQNKSVIRKLVVTK